MERVELVEQDFDLNELFTLNYSFDKLKEVLAFLLRARKADLGRIAKLEKQVADHSQTLADHANALQDANQAPDVNKELDDLKERMDKLEKRSDEMENVIYDTNNNLEHTRRGIERALTSIDDFDENNDQCKIYEVTDPVYEDDTRSRDSFLFRNKRREDANRTEATVDPAGDRSTLADRIAMHRASEDQRVSREGSRHGGRQEQKTTEGQATPITVLSPAARESGGLKPRKSRDRVAGDNSTIGVDFYRRPLRDSRIAEIERRLDNLERNHMTPAMTPTTDIPASSLLSRGAQPSDTAANELAKALGRMRAEIAEKYAPRDIVSELRERVKRVEEKSRKNGFDIENLQELLNELKAQLADKADVAALDSLGALVEQLLSSGGNQSAGISKLIKEQQKMKQLMEKVERLENFTQVISKDYKRADSELDARLGKLEKEMQFKANLDDIQKLDGNIREIAGELKALQKALAELAERVGVLEDTVGKLLERLDLLEQRLAGILKKISDLSQRQNVTKPTMAAEPSALNLGDILDRIQQLKNELSNLKREFNKSLKDLEAKVDNKADQDALVDLENKILEKLDAVISTLNKKFADKAETKKAIRALDKQLRHLLENMHNQGPEGDDAMFARKPLGGWSCASCEKGLINLYGLMAEYYPWSRFPLRDPQDRIARVGQGFSKMLAKLDPHAMAAGRETPRGMSPDEGPGHSLDGTQHMPDRGYSKSTPYLPHLQASPQMPSEEQNTGPIVGGMMMRNESLPKIAKMHK